MRAEDRFIPGASADDCGRFAESMAEGPVMNAFIILITVLMNALADRGVGTFSGLSGEGR